jgi:hypothetical protein
MLARFSGLGRYDFANNIKEPYNFGRLLIQPFINQFVQINANRFTYLRYRKNNFCYESFAQKVE